ncbi:MAG TPA: hypothetical protein VI933_04450 [archaeon]|nr:hypothetical protein [archaeon]
MARRNFDIIDADPGRITALTGSVFPYDSVRVGGRNYIRSDFSREEDGTWTGVYRDAELGGVDPWDVWNDVFTANGGSVPIFQHSIGGNVPPTEFVRFRRPETPSIPLAYSQPPQKQESYESQMKRMTIDVLPEPDMVRYGAATSAGRYVPAYFPGMDTRTPEGLGFPGRLVLASSLPGGKKK